jgi:hypothetical protein
MALGSRLASLGSKRRRGGALVGVGVVGALVAFAAGSSAALVVPTGRSCACAQPPDLVVSNAGRLPVVVTWRQESGPLVPDAPTAPRPGSPPVTPPT